MLEDSNFLSILKKLALKNSPNMISYHQANGDYIYVNESAEALLGYKPQELVGKPAYNFIHPDDQEHIEMNSHRPVLRGEIVKDIRYRLKKKNGGYRWLESRVVPVKEEQMVRNIIVISRDIEREHELEEKLKKEKKVNYHVSEIADIGYWSYNLKDLNIIWSPKIYDIFGLPRDTDIDLDQAFSYFSKKSKISFEKAFKEAVEKGMQYRLKLSLTDAGGNQKWVKVMVSPLMKRGKCVKIFGLLQDVTELDKVANDKIYSLSEYLNGQNQLIKEFSQITSHDLRGPASAIKMLLEDARENDDFDKTEFLDLLDENLGELSKKIDYLSKITGSSLKTATREKISISNCIDEVLEKNQDIIKEYHIHIVREISEWDLISYDRIKLITILQNLVENAIFYSDPKKVYRKLIFKKIIKNRRHQIVIEDNGIGMDPKKLKLKELMGKRRLHPEISNSGLGLFTTKIIVEGEKGQMDIFSRPGMGTRIRIVLDKFKF